MYVKQLKIKNYRNFSDPPFCVDLKPFTLILGENNIGKTNLLNALCLIFSQDITIFRKRILEIDDINYHAINKFKSDVCNRNIPPEQVLFPEVRIDVFVTDLNEDQQAIVGHWAINQKISEAQITYVFTPKSSFQKKEWIVRQREQFASELLPDNITAVDFPINEYRYSIYGSNDPGRDCEVHLLNLLKMEYLDALRDAQKELIASGDYRLLYRILSRRDETKYSEVKKKLNELEELVRNNPNLSDVKLEVTTLLDRVSLRTRGVDNSVAFSFSSLETQELLKKLSMVYGEAPVNVSRNGLGRNNLLFIALVMSHLSSHDARGNDTFFRLIAIEEPEAHLHPHLQDHLAENIEAVREQSIESKETMQLLLTSHSTHIAAKLRLENTVIVYRDETDNQLKSHYVLSHLDPISNKSDKESIRYLSKYLDATKSRMFFARKIILVEGISEQLLIPKLFEIYNGASNKRGANRDTLESNGCNVVNVNGIAFKHFLRVIQGGFFIKCLVLTDSDTGKRVENRAPELKQEFSLPNLIDVAVTQTSTFEKDLIDCNKSGNGKRMLLNALVRTKPQNGKKFERDYQDKELDIEMFFNEIEGYKSEFAFNLLEQLNQSSDSFQIPHYIMNGFSFLGQGNV